MARRQRSPDSAMNYPHSPQRKSRNGRQARLSPKKSPQKNKKPFAFEDTRKADKARIQALERQLKEINVSKRDELEELQQQTKQCRKDCKARVKSYQEAKRQGETINAQLIQNEDLIDTLRKENAKIRERNHVLQQNIANLKTNNERLTKTTTHQDGYYERLQQHHKRVTEENHKLNANCEDLEKRTDEVGDDMRQAEEKARCEYRIRSGAARTMRLMVSMMDDRCEQDEVVDAVNETIDLLEHAKKEWAPEHEVRSLPPSQWGSPAKVSKPKVKMSNGKKKGSKKKSIV